ncbi:MAG: ATP-binding cassette domain-containing protein [Muribaculaceae bacterium]|nr:ATP-binding cassette domain-containing protein [Muribaculaceae bacterium]
MISVNNVSVDFSAHPLFSDVSFVINPTDKIALVGKNGAGKSTLLKILAGSQSPTSGSISIPSGCSVGYLPQQMRISDDTTIIEETRKAFRQRFEMKEELESLNVKLSEITNFEGKEYERLLERIGFLTERLSMEGDASVEAEIEKTLIGLGFQRTDFERPTSEFSGGWRMRVELAKILLQRPDVLLLDEPTNHLDIESIQWLEQFLISKAKAVVLVSHDRAFLDNISKRTIEISCGNIYDYKVNYSSFKKLREERLEQQRRAYDNQQKLIAETKEFIERFRYQATKAIQVQSRIKQLEKIVPIQVDEVDNSRLRLKFPPAPRSGDYPLIVEGLRKDYGDHNVFSDVEFTLERGEKVAFVGKNGEGKSTLVKCIMNQIPFEGTLKVGHNVKIGYFAQNQAQLLDENLTVFETIDNVATGDMRTKVKDILGAFMFGGESSEKYVKVLSGGEKTRLAMIKLLLEPVNLLILDEPTNHLDIQTKDILKEAIRDFDGTVIVVSHDRDFLDGLVEKVYEFGGGKVRENLGGIYDFLQKKRIENLSELEINGRSNSDGKESTSNSSPSSEVKSAGKLSYEEQKERDRQLRKLEKTVKDKEKSIEKFEEKITFLESRLAHGDSSSEILNDYERTKHELEQEMEEWEKAQLELDDFRDSF